MMFEKLTLRSVTVRPVLVPLRRPVVSKVGLFDQWPIILIDLETEEGIVGRSYLEPYLKHAVAFHRARHSRSRRPAHGSADSANRRFSAGAESAEPDRLRRCGDDCRLRPRHGGWDALAKAANMPLAVFLGGSLGPVPAYNSNGLVAHRGCDLGRGSASAGRRRRLQGAQIAARAATGWATTSRRSQPYARPLAPDIKLMVDFNQGLSLGDALHRCHALDEPGPLLV